jgi:hypothetical protein
VVAGDPPADFAAELSDARIGEESSSLRGGYTTGLFSLVRLRSLLNSGDVDDCDTNTECVSQLPAPAGLARNIRTRGTERAGDRLGGGRNR